MKKTHSVSQKFLGRTSSNDTDSAPETTLLPVVPPSGDLRVLRSSKSSLTTLDNDGKLSPTTLQLKVAKAWGKSGRDPVILPTWMAEAPMWFDPKVATSTTGIRKVYTGKYNESDAGTQDENCAKYGKLAIEMHNPAARQGPISPHGLLRYGDLDIVVAIMRECLGRETRSIEYEAGRLLDWLGKDYNMSTSAYKLLRSSIMRLTSTQIVIYLDGAEQFLPDSEMPAPFTILVNDGRQPERGVIRGKISDYMAHDINEGKLWQLFDAKAYRQLMLTTKSGLARVIYLFLSSLRQQNSTFTCLSSWLQERYGELLHGRYRFKSPYDASSRIQQALQEIASSGVIAFALDDTHKTLTGTFANTTILPNLPSRTSRPAFLGHGFTLQPTLSENTSTSSTSPDSDEVVERPLPDPIHESIGLLNRKIRCNKSTLDAAKKSDWQQSQIMFLMIEVLCDHAEGIVLRPGGFITTLFIERSPSDYDKLTKRALQWILNESEWYELPWLKVHRAASARRKQDAIDAATLDDAKNIEKSPDIPASVVDLAPATPHRIPPPPDLIAAWHYALNQVSSSAPVNSVSAAWFNPKKIVVLAMDQGWLVVEASDPLHQYGIADRFGLQLAQAAADAIGVTAAVVGLRVVAKSSKKVTSQKSIDIPLVAAARS